MIKTFKIAGSGIYFPQKKLYATDLDKQYGFVEGTVFHKSGIHIRHIATETETQSSMAAHAAFDALKQAGIAFEELDALVCANGTAQQLIPCNAALLQKEMGFENSGVACFDINSTCLGFITALDLMSCAIATERFKKILIVASDITSVGINWDDLEFASLFGDGAAAFVLDATALASESSTILSSHMKTFSSGAELCQVKSGGTRKLGYNYTKEIHNEFLFTMDGPKVFKAAVQHIQLFFEETLAKAGISAIDLDHVIPHQASQSALELIRRRLKLPEHKFHNQIKEMGNCVAATIPILFHQLREKECIQKGQKVMLLGTGAGLSLGALILSY